MKSIVLSALVCAALLFSGHESSAQIKTPAASPAASISQSIGLGELKVDYSRPSLKGRKMFGAQVPYGQVWRTGANKATTITLTEPMEIGGKEISAGKYGLLTIPEANEWTIIISKDAEAWGSYTYKQENDVHRFKAKVEKLAKPEEHFTITTGAFTGSTAEVVLRWEYAQVRFKVTQNSDAKIMAEIKEKTSAADAGAPTFIAAANYYYDNNKDLNQAFEWATKAVEKNQAFWVYYLRAKIAAKLGKCDVAIKDAEKGTALAKEAKDAAYLEQFANLVKACGKK